jgi:hypothetical protein
MKGIFKLEYNDSPADDEFAVIEGVNKANRGDLIDALRQLNGCDAVRVIALEDEIHEYAASEVMREAELLRQR